ncbi:hypothetical protein [Halioxenophilus aromaticivorans]|uniref:hypothetical protein n=1 Tax=Halioxenophilus aromaticivorans TaxID=1306992 RepID=UPI0031F0CDB3
MAGYFRQLSHTFYAALSKPSTIFKEQMRPHGANIAQAKIEHRQHATSLTLISTHSNKKCANDAINTHVAVVLSLWRRMLVADVENHCYIPALANLGWFPGNAQIGLSQGNTANGQYARPQQPAHQNLNKTGLLGLAPSQIVL